MGASNRLTRLTADLAIPAVKGRQTSGPPTDSSEVATKLPEAVAPVGEAQRSPEDRDAMESYAAAPKQTAANVERGDADSRAASSTDAGQATLASKFPPIGGPRSSSPRTGPGELMAFRGQLLESERETVQLRERLAEHEGSLPTRKIDPTTVIPSRWANRHASSFDTPEFARFKADIEQAGGNVQPILVRPSTSEAGKYELVFGHRRHRACLNLGLPVLAAIAEASMTDAELFAAMDRENRERADLSVWEQGTMYRRAIEEGMFSSQRRLAEALGVSHTWVGKAIGVAELPEFILQCFRSPIELNIQRAEAISGALQADRKGVQRRAERLRQGERLSAASVVTALIGKNRGHQQQPRDIRSKDALLGRLTWDARGQATIRLRPGVANIDNLEAILSAVASAAATPTKSDG